MPDVNSVKDDGIADNTEATVDYVDDAGQIHLKEFGIAVIPGIDDFEIK